MSNLFDTDITGVDRLPTSVYATSVPSYPYISAPSNSPSNLYPTSTVTWPYCQGINPVPSPAYAPNYTPWQTQSPFDPATSVATTPQRTGRSSLVQPYAQRIQTANTGNPQVATGSLGSLGFGLGLHMSDMQDYPSPGSSTSGQTTSSYVPVLPPNVLSPSMPLMPSPSMAESTGSRQSSRRSQEAPRNAEGLLYCDHAEHAQQQPPVFSRKCEWRRVNPFYLSEYRDVHADILVIENTWINTRDPSSAKSPNAKTSAASPIPAVSFAINEKYIANMAGPKHLACAHIQIASDMLA